MKWILIALLIVASGCVATTKIVVTHSPQDDLKYTVTHELTTTY